MPSSGRRMHAAAWLPAMAICACASGVVPDEAGNPFAGSLSGVDEVSSEASDSAEGTSDTDAASTGDDAPDELDDGPRPPRLLGPLTLTLHEEQAALVTLEVEDPDGDAVRVWLTDLPPGAVFEETTRRLHFTPDFTQGDEAYVVGVTLDDGLHRVSTSIELSILDDVSPPSPEIRDEWVDADGIRWLEVVQVTDAWLDPPALAGREVAALIAVPPTEPHQTLPVRMSLHSFGGLPSIAGWYEEIRVAPHDPDDTYWWGMDRDWPAGPVEGDVVLATTQRRVLHLLDFVLEELPEADSERVYVSGSSMGGAGALSIGLRHARHFAAVRGSWAMTMPRHHRPARIEQLSTVWGPPSVAPDDPDSSAWDAQDAAWLLTTSEEARETWIGLHLSKDDPHVHFSSLVGASAVAGLSPLEALQNGGVAHFVVWDEAGHGGVDPTLGETWWGSDLSPIHASTAYVRRDRALVAFSRASHDGIPGAGGDGTRPWSVETGFAGDPAVAGDTGWAGDRAGSVNRHLEWDAAELIETFDEFRVRLRIRIEEGGPALPPSIGADPHVGDAWPGPLPVVADVTPRRLQRFACRPGEVLSWTFGTSTGTVTCASSGRFTIEALPLWGTWQTLVVARTP